VSGDRAVAIDAGAVGVVGAAIVAGLPASPGAMLALVAAVVLARFALWSRRVPGAERLPLGGELGFFAAATLLGAANDWNTVVRHRVYDYAVPSELAIEHALPVWMLLAWGLILRGLATVAGWRRLRPPAAPRDQVYLAGRVVTSAPLKIALQLALIAVTRQVVYRAHGDALWSWLPFALAVLAWIALFRPDRRDRVLLGAFAVVGPLVEVLFIQAGGLHAYALGWLGGVPLWIVLWWVLAVAVWADLSARLVRWLAGRAPGSPGRTGFRSGA
jgi:hypothetical protein